MVRYRPALQEGKKPGRGSLSSPIVNNHYIIRLIWSTVLCPETMPSHLATAAANSELWPAMPLKWNAWSDRRNTRLLPECLQTNSTQRRYYLTGRRWRLPSGLTTNTISLWTSELTVVCGGTQTTSCKSVFIRKYLQWFRPVNCAFGTVSGTRITFRINLSLDDSYLLSS